MILARLCSLLSGLALIFVVSRLFSIEEQGIFYTFLSLGAAQFFFDLGAGFTLGNIAARQVTDDHVDRPAFSETSLPYVTAYTRLAMRWAGASGAVLIVVVGTVGAFVLTRAQPAAETLPIWAVYIALVAVVMGFQLLLRVFDALGFVVETAVTRAVQSLSYVVVLYALAAQGIGLWSLPLAYGFGLAVAAVFFATRSHKIRSAFLHQFAGAVRVSWREDLLPFQLRMSVSWITGYIIFQAQVPILYALSGPEAAGLFGIMVQIFQALNTSANIFPTYRIRDWTKLAASGEGTVLHHSLVHTTALTVALMAIGGAAALAAIWGFTHWGIISANRFPEFDVLALYAAASTVNQVFFCLAYYFRARGEEPLWWVSVLAAAGILVVPIVLGAGFGIAAAITSFFWVSVLCLAVLSAVYSFYYVKKHPVRPMATP